MSGRYDNIVNEYEDGESTTTLGRKYGVHRNSIALALKRRGVVNFRGKRKTKIDYELAEKMYIQGMSAENIGLKLGITAGALIHGLRRRDVPIRSRASRYRWDVEEAISMYNSEIPTKEILKKYGIHNSTMMKAFKKMDVNIRSRDNWISKNRSNQKCRRLKYGKAHIVVQGAIITGALVRPSKCSECGVGTDKAIGHHDNYNKPLDVRWLCDKCHLEWHRNNKPVEYAP